MYFRKTCKMYANAVFCNVKRNQLTLNGQLLENIIYLTGTIKKLEETALNK